MYKGRWLAAALLSALLLSGAAAAAEVSPSPSPVPATEEAAEETDPLLERLAAARKEIRTRKLGTYGMVPIYGRDVRDGEYEIRVDSSSQFFKIIAAKLLVRAGQMLAQITLSSMS